MDQGILLDVASSAIWLIIELSMPTLIFALTVGLIVSIFQATTSIQEPTLAFAPKIVAVFFALIIFGPWMLTKISNFTTNLLTNINVYLR
ncbi:MAG: flagellar biosynthesis protein FliQ [Clostridia bacterium]|jgi:flagellar biosynthetic protein FliQ|nr:flagellar biosynthesis protein FliQ [Clostridia bacterium]